MIIKYSELSSHLKHPLLPIYIICGPEIFLQDNVAHKIKAAWHPDSEQRHLSLTHDKDWYSLLDEANSYHLFSTYTCQDAYYDKKTWGKHEQTIVLNYLESFNARSLILIRAPNIKINLMQWAKSLPNLMIIHIQSLNPRSAQNYIIETLKSFNIRYTAEVPNIIYRYTEGNLGAAIKHIETLSLVYDETCVLDSNMVQEHLAHQCEYPLYELTEACLQQNTEKALHILRIANEQKIDLTLILWHLCRYIRQLIQLHTLQQTFTWQQSCQKLNIWTSLMPNYQKIIQQTSKQTCLHLLLECHKTDLFIKTNQVQEAWRMLDNITVRLCKPKNPLTTR